MIYVELKKKGNFIWKDTNLLDPITRFGNKRKFMNIENFLSFCKRHGFESIEMTLDPGKWEEPIELEKSFTLRGIG